MKCYLSSFLALTLALSGCGKSDQPGPAATDNPLAPATSASAAGAGPDTPTPGKLPAAAPEGPFSLADLKISGKGWKGEYNKTFEDWGFRKVTPGHDGTNEESSFLVGVLSYGSPKDLEGYAAKLKKEDFESFGEVWTEISEQGELSDGFYILGLAKNYKSPKAKPELALVVVRKIGGAYIHGHSTDLETPELRQEALEMLKAAGNQPAPSTAAPTVQTPAESKSAATDTAQIMQAENLSLAYQADEDATIKKYSNRVLTLIGAVVYIGRTSQTGQAISIGGEKGSVGCKMGDKVPDTVKEGQVLVIRGTFSRFAVTATLLDCTIVRVVSGGADDKRADDKAAPPAGDTKPKLSPKAM
jgi:hypothetical protein